MTVSISNNGNVSIAPPLRLVLIDFTSSFATYPISLKDAAGVTDAGDPYILLNDYIDGELAPGDTIGPLTLTILGGGRSLFNFLPRIDQEQSPQGPGDSDGDGLTDDVDLCPDTPPQAPVDVNGCAESQKDDDNDGVNNALDQCPNTEPGLVIDSQGCAAQQLDSDNDGVSDAVDQCPNTEPQAVVDTLGCADSQKDDDNDGVNNALDQCPNTGPGIVVDAQGCPVSQTDRDNDGYNDDVDVFPDDPNEWSDRDGDGIGDNSDLDRDGDGISNVDELQFGSDPDNAQDVPVIPAPSVSINGGTTHVTDAESIVLSGVIDGGYPPIARAYFTSDRLSGIEFAISPVNGAWQAEILLELGDNQVQIIALDSIGQSGSVSANIERRAAAVIDLRVDSPRDGTVVTEPSVVFSGRVISEVPIDPPQVVVNSQAASVSQGNIATEYTFQSPVISLNEGNNTITVWALAGSKSIQKTVLVSYQPAPELVEPPLITIRSPQPGSTQNTDSFTFMADIYSTIGLKTVTLNGQTISPVSGSLVQEVIGFAEGESVIDLILSVTDNLDQVSSHSVRYLRDTIPPQLQIDGLAAFPQENTVTENPYLLSGSVSDSALSQLLINDQPVGLTPTATVGSYRFQAPLVLSAGTAQSVVVSAIDAGGNRSQQDFLLALLNNIGIEWITPQDNLNLLIDGSGQTLDISARVSNLTGNEHLIAYFAGREGEAISLTVAQGLLSASIPLSDAEGAHTLWLEARDSNDTVLARASRSLTLKAQAAVPLQVIRVSPADGAQNLDANTFITVLFNKPIELAKVTLDLRETVHGDSYIDSDPPGVDGLIAQGYVLQNITRDYEPVPCVLSLLPDASGVVFYP
ncbi:MAG: thrombospondin type 3 repeat-containing protein [Gammaproteobacteria bacterium]|nr:thrombospondin type 3 repeat-containing protein [Gammaproteobacteria bacterium]